MKTTTRILSVLLLTMMSTIVLSSCEVQISNDGVSVGVLTTDLESRQWCSTTDYNGYSITRTLYFDSQGTGTYSEVIDYYDENGNIGSEHVNNYNLTWTLSLDGNMDIYLSDNSHLTFDGITFVSEDDMYGWFDGEKIYFQD
jgi:hypothetical protein